MPNSAVLQSNVLAAIDENPLNPEMLRLLADYATATETYFCRRCGACEATNTDSIPIFDIMEMLMYSRGYDRPAYLRDMVSQRFAQMPSGIQSKIESSDYSNAQKMPIAQLMKEAYLEFHKE